MPSKLGQSCQADRCTCSRQELLRSKEPSKLHQPALPSPGTNMPAHFAARHLLCCGCCGCWRQNSPHTRSTSAAVFMADLAPDCGLVALPHLPPACERVPAGRRSCAGGWQRRTARMGSDSQTNVSNAESQCFCYGMRTGCARCRWRGHRCARGHAEGTGARCAQPLCWFDLAPLY